MQIKKAVSISLKAVLISLLLATLVPVVLIVVLDLLGFLGFGWHQPRPASRYKVVEMQSYFDKTQDAGNGGQMILYTIAHGSNTIRARCQPWDPIIAAPTGASVSVNNIKNNCNLEVGKEYDLERERGMGGFDTLCLYNDPKEAEHATTVLVVEEEKAR